METDTPMCSLCRRSHAHNVCCARMSLMLSSGAQLQATALSMLAEHTRRDLSSARDGASPHRKVIHVMRRLHKHLLLADTFHRHVVQVHPSINDEQWIGLCEHILVDADPM